MQIEWEAFSYFSKTSYFILAQMFSLHLFLVQQDAKNQQKKIWTQNI